jgi:3-oxoacid CoA-transferase A subunit
LHHSRVVTSKVVASFDEAVSGFQDGASVMVGGFAHVGAPHNLVEALNRQGAKDLTLIANSGANPREGALTMATLIDGRRVKKVIFAFTAATHPSRPVGLQALQASGEVEAELVPQGTLAERIRCGGAGIPAFYTPAAVGTELAEGKEHRVFNGRTYLLEHALTADYAFVRAWKADEFGNLVFRQSQRNFNPIMATAADCTIVEAEEIVPVGSLDPDEVHTSGIWVQRVVKIGDGDILHLKSRLRDDA